MKIVTAGHRGIVATGDEIRGLRDNKYRLFAYSLILLFSLLAPGSLTQAQAAKLCFNLNGPQTPLNGSSWSDYELGSQSKFRLGGNCANNKPCTLAPAIIGQARCGATADAYPASANLSAFPVFNNSVATAHCFCQLAYPWKGPAVYAGTMNNVSGQYKNHVCEWGDHCAELCRSKAMGDAAFFNALLGKS